MFATNVCWVEKRNLTPKTLILLGNTKVQPNLRICSLNICPDMTGFERIVPCGISDKPVGSLAEWIPDITCEEVRFYVAHSFAEVFGVELVESQPQGFFRSE